MLLAFRLTFLICPVMTVASILGAWSGGAHRELLFAVGWHAALYGMAVEVAVAIWLTMLFPARVHDQQPGSASDAC